MLSRVVKGTGAREMPTMAFATVATEPVQARSAAPQTRPSTGPPTGEEEAALLAKIQTLEATLVNTKREAFEAGRQQGEQAARAAFAPVIERLNHSIAEIVNMRPELRRRAEKDAVELALRIAQRVLHRELSTDNNALNALARVVFDRLGRSESWNLTVHPQFADAIRGALPAASLNKVKIEADPSCVPGTLIVRCTDGVVDASVESQLAEIGRGLTDRLARI